MTQIKLFEPQKAPERKIPFYRELTIHEKINYKANLCGFAGNALNNHGKWFRIEHKTPTDSLTQSYWWHIHHNHGRTKYWNQKEYNKKMPRRRAPKA